MPRGHRHTCPFSDGACTARHPLSRAAIPEFFFTSSYRESPYQIVSPSSRSKPEMASRHGSETAGSATSASRGVWGFMKRKVWGDVPSHPISDSGSDSRAASPEPAVNSPVDMSTPKATTPHEESRPQSPFQGHDQPDHDSQSDEDAPESQQTGLCSTSNKTSNMASEPSLRHGLGEGKHFDPSLYSICCLVNLLQACMKQRVMQHSKTTVLALLLDR